MAELFGTDGIRGVAGTELTADLAFRLGGAVARLISEKKWDKKVLIGRDSRISGPMLESAIASSIMAGGCDVHLLDIAPTPVVAFLTRHMEFPLGCVISASHNPIEDNGIKFFDIRGMKVEKEIENQLEKMLVPGNFKSPVIVGDEIGTMYRSGSLTEEYVRHLLDIGQDNLRGLRIIIDGAHGAGATLAPSVFTLLECHVFPINCVPDGERINVMCGATNTGNLTEAVIHRDADMGIALDGDADRAILIDEKGRIVDGDQILAMWAKHLIRKNSLPKNTVVGTVLSNMGLEVALNEIGARLVRADVGDKHVLDEMLNSGAIIGGEQSGHIIFLNHQTTGDGILTALMVAMLMRETGLPLSELGNGMLRFPQVQLNITVKDKKTCLENQKIISEIEGLTKKIEKINGRMLVRPSGTEPLIRVMTEAPDEAVAREFAEKGIALFRTFSTDGRVTEI